MKPTLGSLSSAPAAFVIGCLAALPAFAWYPEWVYAGNVAASGVRGLFTADVNEDGHPDVLALTDEQDVTLFRAASEGGVDTPTQVYTTDSLADAVLADVDGDGTIDLIAADDTTNKIAVVPSNGDGTFAAPIETTLAFSPSQIAAADYDEDGHADLAIQSDGGDVIAIYRGLGDGHFVEAAQVARAANAVDIVSGDVDHDGHADVVVANESPFGYDVYFGNGDGTLSSSPLTVTGASARPSRIDAADLDHDGDLDLISCQSSLNTLTVVVNLGARTFAAPVSYGVVVGPPGTGNPYDFVVGDVDGDDDPDVVVTVAGAGAIATLSGHGNGSFANPVFATPPILGWPAFPKFITAADFTDDGRLDVAIATGSAESLVLMANAAGDSEVTLGTKYPTISAGQTTTFTVHVGTAGGHFFPSNRRPPTAIGDVVLKNGDTTIATATLQNGSATFDVNSLPVGNHAITASWDGVDDLYRPSTSPAVEQHVVAWNVTVTLQSAANGAEIPYGQLATLTANVTSPIGGSTEGSFWLYTDGQRSDSMRSGTSPIWNPSLATGTHTFSVQYEGNAAQPPGTSNIVTQVVRKADTTLAIDNFPTHARYGQQPQVSPVISAEAGGDLRGIAIGLYEGNTLLATTTTYTSFSLPVLPPGVHYLHIVHEGNENYNGSESPFYRYTVVPTDNFVVDAIHSGSAIRASGWFSAPLGTRYLIYRRIGSGPWTSVSSLTFVPSWDETSPQPGTVYAFYMEAYNNSNVLIATSNVDMAMAVTFADDPVQSGMPVKAQHMTEVLDAANVVRADAGLSALTLPGIAPGQPILASHVVAIQDALNEARAAFGAAPVSLSPTVAAGTLIRMKHIQDLRDALR